MNVNFIPDLQNIAEISKFENDLEIGDSIKAINELLIKKDKNFIKYISILTRLNSNLVYDRNFSIEKLIKIDSDDKSLKIFVQCIYNILASKLHDDIDRIKGLFPEAYIYLRFKNSYTQYIKLERECYVEIDTWSSRVHRTSEQGQLIDVGSWNPQHEEGKVFECKIGVGIKEHQLDLLDNIINQSNNKLNIFLASFAKKEVIKNRIDEMKIANPSLKTAKLNIFGVEDMLCL